MWQGAGVIRSNASLNKVLAGLEEIKSILVNIGNEGVGYLEFRNMLLVGEIITRAALFRTETRGSHFRTDFPEKDDSNWLLHTSITMKNEQISLEKVKVNQDID